MKTEPRQYLHDLTHRFHETCVVFAAAELDLFTVLLQKGNLASVEELTDAMQTDVRGTAMLLDSLTASGCLCKKEGRYSVAEPFQELLDSRSAASFVPMLRHCSCAQRAWVRLAETVKIGNPPDVKPSILGAEEDLRSFIGAMNSVAYTCAEPAVTSLQKAGLLTFKTMLDIGGASGTYTLAFLQAMPELSATIFDLPVGIAAARKRFIGSEFESRVQLIEGDIFRDAFPAGFEFAWISAIIHQFDRNENRILYKKTFSALDTGGTVAIRDFVMNSDRTSPAAGTFFGISMLVETLRGGVYTFDEIREDLESAGFKDVRFTVPNDTMSAIVTAVK